MYYLLKKTVNVVTFSPTSEALKGRKKKMKERKKEGREEN